MGIESLKRWEYARVQINVFGNTLPESDRVLFTHTPMAVDEGGSAWDAMRQLGDDGWELVSTNALHDGIDMYFKRPQRGGRVRY